MTASLVLPTDVDVQSLVAPLPPDMTLPQARTSLPARRSSRNIQTSNTPGKPVRNANQNVNRPDGSRLTQQQLPMWEPVLTLGWSVGICFFVAATCVLLGAAVLHTSSQLTSLRVVYDGDIDSLAGLEAQPDGRVERLGNCRLDKPEDANSFHSDHTCYVHMTLPATVRAPVRVFYELDQYHQNHRRFVSSMVRSQFTDDWRPDGLPLLACEPLTNITSPLCSAGSCEPATASETRQPFPCGIVANTMFNDIFWLHSGLLPSGETLSRTDLVSKGIARTFAAHNHKNPSWALSTHEFLPVWHNPNTSRLIPPVNGPHEPHITDDYTNSTAWVHDPLDARFGVGVGVENEWWRVWVDGAALQPFHKAYGRIERDLPANTTLVFAVQSNFFVRAFGGSKALVLGEVGWFGSANPALGGLFLALGAIFALAGALFAIRLWRGSRALGDAAFLAWKSE